MHGWDLPEEVILREIGPREWARLGSSDLSPEEVVHWVDRLTEVGFGRIDVTSMIGPSPGADTLMARIERKPGVLYGVMVSNPEEAGRALKTEPDELTLLMSASETFSHLVVGCSVAESLMGFSKIGDMAREAGVALTVVIAAAFGCPFEGHVPRTAVLDLVSRLDNLGIVQVVLSDTAGLANPAQVASMVRTVEMNIPMAHLSLQFQDSRGLAVANMVAAVIAGAYRFDTAVGGIGGFQPMDVLGDNLPSEAAVYCLHAMGIETGVGWDRLMATAEYVADHLGRGMPSRVFEARGRLGRESEELA